MSVIVEKKFDELINTQMGQWTNYSYYLSRAMSSDLGMQVKGVCI